MAYIDQFTLPVKGLHAGEHQFSFKIDNRFFELFRNELIEEGIFDVHTTLDNHPDRMILTIRFEGFWGTQCDRCTADIQLPVDAAYTVLIKYGEKEADEGDVIYILREANEINIAAIIFDTICICLPIRKTYNCRESPPYPCDEVVLQKITPDREVRESEPENQGLWAGLTVLDLESEE